jgi:hypothetical protein
MRVRLRYALPLGQMTLAAVCLRLEFLNGVAQRGADSRGLSPAFLLLECFDFPVSFPLKLTLYGYLPALWFGAFSVAAIGMFWYWVALWIDRYNKRRPLFQFVSAPLRIVADVLVIAMGACLGWFLIAEARDYPHNGPLSLDVLGWWFIPTNASLLFWTVGPILIFGKDLIQYLRLMICRATTEANAVDS